MARAAAVRTTRKLEISFISILLTAVGRAGRWFGEKSEGRKRVERPLGDQNKSFIVCSVLREYYTGYPIAKHGLPVIGQLK